MNKNILSVCLVLWLSCASASAAEDLNPYIGRWALTIPGGGAGWLGVAETNGQPVAHILWGGGSVVPVDRAKMGENTLNMERDNKVRRRDAKGKVMYVWFDAPIGYVSFTAAHCRDQDGDNCDECSTGVYVAE